MTIEAKSKLVGHQQKLIQERRAWEQMQTDFSFDLDFYKFCTWKMNLFDEEAEQLRYVLETEGCE